jgi:Domain of unknown function (DUF4410)
MLETNLPEESLMLFSPARHGKFSWAIRIFLLFVLSSAFGVFRGIAQPQATESPLTAIPILVSDFELFSVAGSVTPPATPPATSPATPPGTTRVTPIATPSATPIASVPATAIVTPPVTPAAAPSRQKPPLPPVDGDSDSPSLQARRLTDFFTATLVQTLQKKGYNARTASGQTPPSGAIVRGVFTEPDGKNRVRRALLGAPSGNTKFFLYVGIFNLGRPDQPLYQLASDQPGGDPYGPVITLSNYIPLAKYELDKNPTEEDVRKICAQIAASLTALLGANPSAFSQ